MNHALKGPLAALAVLLLLAAACTTGTDDSAAPVADPAATPTAEPSGDASDNEAGDEPGDVEERLADIAEEVASLRGLDILEPVDTQIVTQEELARIVADESASAERAEEVAAMQQVLVALRHLAPDADLESILDTLLAEGVAGLYVPEDEAAYVSSAELPLTPAGAVTAAHELHHALQDQHFDLARLDDIPDSDADAAQAFLAVVEGDAIHTEQAWAAANLSQEEQAEYLAEQQRMGQQQAELLRDLPGYVLESFIFPYVAGEQFVAALREAGGDEAVDAAIVDPPTTTVEILDPALYLDGFTVAEVSIDASPGGDWSPSIDFTFGAFELLLLLYDVDPAGAREAAGAWRGGRLAAWERGDEVAVTVALAFDEAASATAACESVGQWYESAAGATETQSDLFEGDRDHMARSCSEREVRIAIAAEADTAQSLRR